MSDENLFIEHILRLCDLCEGKLVYVCHYDIFHMFASPEERKVHEEGQCAHGIRPRTDHSHFGIVLNCDNTLNLAEEALCRTVLIRQIDINSVLCNLADHHSTRLKITIIDDYF
jgi:hypothetical protein